MLNLLVRVSLLLSISYTLGVRALAEDSIKNVLEFSVNGLPPELVCSEIADFSNVTEGDVHVFVVTLVKADALKFAGLTKENLGKDIFVSIGKSTKKLHVKTPIYTGVFMFSVLSDAQAAQQWSQQLEYLRSKSRDN